MSDDSNLKNLEFDELSDKKSDESNLVVDEVVEPLEVSFEFEDSNSKSKKDDKIKGEKEGTENTKDSESLDLSIAEAEPEQEASLGLEFEVQEDEISDSDLIKEETEVVKKDEVSQDGAELAFKEKSSDDEGLSFSLEEDEQDEEESSVVEIEAEDEVKKNETKDSVEEELGLVEEENREEIDIVEGAKDYIESQKDVNVEDELAKKLKEISDLKNELSKDFQSKDYFNDLEEKNNQTKKEFLSQYENYEKFLEDRNRKFPIDIVVYIVLGSTFLIGLNYYFFRSTEVPQIKSTPKVEKIKLLANKKKKKKIKKQELKIEDLKVEGKKDKISYKSDLMLENGLVKKLSLQIEIDAPDPLTDQEIVAGQIHEPWIKRASFSEVSLVQTSSGELFGTGKAKVYLEYQGKKSRVLSDIRIAGNVADKKVRIKAVISNNLNKSYKEDQQVATITDEYGKVFFKITNFLSFEIN